MKAPFPYYGGKQRVADQIASLLPPHRSYIEPYAGAASVLFAKPPSRAEILNDSNRDLMTLFRMLRDDPLELARVCALTPHSRAEMDLSKERTDDLPDLERARRTWVRLTQGRSASLRKTGWRHFVDPRGSNASTPAYLRTLKERILPTAERLSEVTLECRDAIDVINEYGRFDENLLYVDPPYLASTRNSRGYEFEVSTEAEHAVILDAITAAKGIIVISGYDNPQYNQALAGWDEHHFSARAQNGASRIEKVWANRRLGEYLYSTFEERKQHGE